MQRPAHARASSKRLRRSEKRLRRRRHIGAHNASLCVHRGTLTCLRRSILDSSLGAACARALHHTAVQFVRVRHPERCPAHSLVARSRRVVCIRIPSSRLVGIAVGQWSRLVVSVVSIVCACVRVVECPLRASVGAHNFAKPLAIRCSWDAQRNVHANL